MRRDEGNLLDMLIAARNAVEYTEDLSYEEFVISDLHQNATFRALDIVGVAANRISPDSRNLHAQIPWIDIVGLRNRIEHGYFEMKLKVMWSIVHEEFPILIRELEAITPSE